MSKYTSFKDMPACLNISEVAEIMRISKPTAYALVHQEGFPAVKVADRRYIVPKDLFIQWLKDAKAV